MNQRPPYVSVIDPITPAIERARQMLFRPFDLGKWFVIGFCAWLATLGQGGGPNFNFSQGRGGGFDPGHAKEFILDNLFWIIPAALFVVILIIGLWLVFTWLSSRGRFMFLHCVARDKAEIRVPWTKFRQHSNSLFLFRIVLGLIGLVVIALLVAPGVFVGIALARTGARIGLVLVLVTIGLVAFVVSIAFAIVQKFTTEFVVPIMFLRTPSCRAAWREFLGVLSVNKCRFLLYLLFHIVIGMAIGVIILLGFCATCCIACCILSIPYIGTVLLLPILIFGRSYSLYYLGQFGPEFDVFATEMEPALPA